MEGYITRAGIVLIKYWLEVSNEEQERRFEARVEDPLRQWKLSPMDLPSRERWYDYSRARDRMLEATDSKHAPWHIVRSDDKKRARLNCITHLLSLIPYKKLPRTKIKIPTRSNKGRYDDHATIEKERLYSRSLLKFEAPGLRQGVYLRASAPPTISMSSLVMTPCLVLL